MNWEFLAEQLVNFTYFIYFIFNILKFDNKLKYAVL